MRGATVGITVAPFCLKGTIPSLGPPLPARECTKITPSMPSTPEQQMIRCPANN